MEQKEVVLLGFRCENHNIIKVVELTPDIMQQQLIQIVGDSGNGKSSLLDGLMTAVHGNDAIKKKDNLQPGFLSEVQLLDGDIKLFVGARKRELTKGQRMGEFEVETYLYAKDDEGKQYTPIIDGEPATAAKYMKLLTTELTFSMPDFFTENQTRHRNLIEKLFSEELNALGADDTVAEIFRLRAVRDEARVMTQRNGAYMEQFTKEGLTEEYLAGLKEVDVPAIEQKIKEAEIERDRILNPADATRQLEIERIDKKRSDEVQKLKDAIAELEKAIAADNTAKSTKYTTAKTAYDKQETTREKYDAIYDVLTENIEKYFGKDIEGAGAAQAIINQRQSFLKEQFNLTEPKQEGADEKLAAELKEKQDALKTLEETPVVYPEEAKPDTTAIDKTLKELETSKTAGETTNKLVARYKFWCEWIEAKGRYEAEVDKLRRMYAKIETGVPGLKIVPVDTNTDKVEVWLKYNGEYDTDFFKNDSKELRYIFDYSSFQRSAIGVMLQAARLNLKPKALRLAIVDDVAFTKKGLAVLSNLCASLNVKLITSRTDDVTKDQIKDGEVLMQGGEAFFKHE